MLKSFDTKTVLHDLAERAYGYLYDSNFETTTNNISYLLPIQNGKVINLKTLEVRERTQKDMFTFECNVSLTNETPNADKFFEDIMPNIEDREYLRKCLGYIITGKSTQDVFSYGTETDQMEKAF